MLSSLFLLLAWIVVLVEVAAAAATQCEVDNIQFTTIDQLGPFYVEDSITSSVIAPRRLLIDPTDVFTVNGKIIGNDCKPLAGARVEAWYAGEDISTGEAVYLEDGFRGQTSTDECGNFQFVQTFPMVYPQRPIPHIHYQVSSPETNEVLLVTQLYFNGVIINGYNPDETKISNIINEPDGSRSSTFDIYLNVPGNAEACKASGEGDYLFQNNATTSTPSPMTMVPQNESLVSETMVPNTTGETMVEDTTTTTTTMPPSSVGVGEGGPTGMMTNETGVVVGEDEATTIIMEENTAAAIITGEQQQCGSVVCEPGLECCNPSCGTCAKPGGLCLHQDSCIGPFDEQQTEAEEEEEEPEEDSTSAASLSKSILDLFN